MCLEQGHEQSVLPIVGLTEGIPAAERGGSCDLPFGQGQADNRECGSPISAMPGLRLHPLLQFALEQRGFGLSSLLLFTSLLCKVISGRQGALSSLRLSLPSDAVRCGSWAIDSGRS
jgi:hypothetical protein